MQCGAMQGNAIQCNACVCAFYILMNRFRRSKSCKHLQFWQHLLQSIWIHTLHIPKRSEWQCKCLHGIRWCGHILIILLELTWDIGKCSQVENIPDWCLFLDRLHTAYGRLHSLHVWHKNGASQDPKVDHLKSLRFPKWKFQTMKSRKWHQVHVKKIFPDEHR